MTVSWIGRVAIIASFIKPGESVLDLGAGSETLRNLIDKSCEYVPVDKVKHTGDTRVFDFETEALDTAPFDVVVISGVLEYLEAPAGFLAWAIKCGRRGYISYSPVRAMEEMESRKSAKWKSHLTQAEMERIFDSLGVRHEIVGRWNEQLIWRCAN